MTDDTAAHPGALAGKTAIVTGSSQGIGREVALRFAREGAAVVVNGTGADPDGLPSLVAELGELGGRGVACPGSVADPDLATELVAVAQAAFGPVDILVNVAGLAEPPLSSILSISVEEWQRQLDVHLTGTFLTCRAVVPHMVAQGGGSIVNTTSHAFTGRYGGTGYAAGKGGVNSLTYALAKDLAEHKVRVNAVAPGGRTRLSSGPDFTAHIDALHRRGLLSDAMRDASLHVAPAHHVAPVYCFLASDASVPLSGHVLAASGGYLGHFSPPTEGLLAYREDLPEDGWSVDELAHLTESLRSADS